MYQSQKAQSLEFKIWFDPQDNRSIMSQLYSFSVIPKVDTLHLDVLVSMWTFHFYPWLTLIKCTALCPTRLQCRVIVESRISDYTNLRLNLFMHWEKNKHISPIWGGKKNHDFFCPFKSWGQRSNIWLEMCPRWICTALQNIFTPEVKTTRKNIFSTEVENTEDVEIKYF